MVKKMMKKIIIAALVVVHGYAQEVAFNVKEREHSVRDIIDSVAKSKDKEISIVTEASDMFTDAKISGGLRALYSGYEYGGAQSQYATAVGAQIKYELAEFRGFHAAVEFSSSHDIGFATGEGVGHNAEISSTKGNYTELSQAYINYKNGGVNLRAGRQLIDTPLADSDDIRIIANTFEAYTLSYEWESLTFMGGLLTRWQGTDTGLSAENHWSDTGEDGTHFGGLSYSDDFIDSSVWYYGISKDSDPNSATGNVANSSFYTDISLHIELSKEYALHTSAQYLSQKEAHGSAMDATIYGAMAELVMFEDFALSAAYNKSQKQEGKGSFSGFGGGTLYTNMDSMILDTITMDRDAQALVAGLTYRYNDFGFMYVYGAFDGEANSFGIKERIIEQNIGFEYTPDEKVTFAALYVKNEDKKEGGSNGGDWENVRVLLSYNF